jgi:carboxylesterase type B
MKFLYTLVIIVSLTSVAKAATGPCDLSAFKSWKPTVVNTKYGSLNGLCNKVTLLDPDKPGRTGNVLTWLGVPFAKPPVGSLRFMRPEEPSFWGERNATTVANVCSQVDATKGLTQSEDCLYLNVYAPLREEAEKSKLLPVYIYIHGGSFVTGAAIKLDPTYAVAFSNDIVFVTLDYRLGPFGFMFMPELGIPGNMGFLDQHLALKWIYENIKNFGGDPEKITLGTL